MRRSSLRVAAYVFYIQTVSTPDSRFQFVTCFLPIIYDKLLTKQSRKIEVNKR